MMREMTVRQFNEWRAFYLMEPFGELREDFRNARVLKLLHDINVKPADRKPLKDWLLRFTDDADAVQKPKNEQPSWKRNLQVAHMIAAAYDAACASERQHGFPAGSTELPAGGGQGG